MMWQMSVHKNGYSYTMVQTSRLIPSFSEIHAYRRINRPRFHCWNCGERRLESHIPLWVSMNRQPTQYCWECFEWLIQPFIKHMGGTYQYAHDS